LEAGKGMISSGELLQYLLTGLTVGCIYGLVAVGFNIIYNATGIINFAQGEFVMLGGMTAVWLTQSVGMPVAVAFPLAVLIVTGVGLAVERVAVWPLRRGDHLAPIIITIGASIFIKGLAMLLWGKQTFLLPHFTGEQPIRILGAAILAQHLWVLGLTAVIVIGLGLFFERTLTGKAIRACAHNPTAASLVGINTRLMVALCFALSAAVGAAAGIVITPIILVNYDRGTMLALKGFSAAILGGLGNVNGGLAAGFLIGVLEALSSGGVFETVSFGLISSHSKDALPLVILLAVLFVRPSGLFGGGARREA
jgi:branched-chain amino acid transport system permease protein